MHTLKALNNNKLVDLLCVKTNKLMLELYDYYTVEDDGLLCVYLQNNYEIKNMSGPCPLDIECLYFNLIDVHSQDPFVCKVRDKVMNIIHGWIQNGSHRMDLERMNLLQYS
jgi:hypothetical protein